MKSSQEYWKERALKRAREAYLSEAPLTAKLMDEYERAARNIRREISEFYAKGAFYFAYLIFRKEPDNG